MRRNLYVQKYNITSPYPDCRRMKLKIYCECFESWKIDTCSALMRKSWSTIGLWFSIQELFCDWKRYDLVWFEKTIKKCGCWWIVMKNDFVDRVVGLGNSCLTFFHVFVENSNMWHSIGLWFFGFAITTIELKINWT